MPKENSKEDYVLRSLAKIKHKRWELFILSRILHKLDDDEIEFTTQQSVYLPGGGTVLTDLYFPQFRIHVEIDEPPHEHSKAKSRDEAREASIIKATKHDIKRIRIQGKSGVEKTLPEIRSEIDDLVDELRKAKLEMSETGNFRPWVWEERFSTSSIKLRGSISVEDNVSFRYQKDALELFGYEGGHYQRGAWYVKGEGKRLRVWFPRLSKHGGWENEFKEEDSRAVIYERAIDEDAKRKLGNDRELDEKFPERLRITFAKSRDVLGFNVLRYVGTFKRDADQRQQESNRYVLVRDSEKLLGV